MQKEPGLERAMEPDLVLSALNVQKVFPAHFEGLVNVNGFFARGAIHAIYGPNGSGKSVFLRGLGGLDPFTSCSLRRF